MKEKMFLMLVLIIILMPHAYSLGNSHLAAPTAKVSPVDAGLSSPMVFIFADIEECPRAKIKVCLDCYWHLFSDSNSMAPTITSKSVFYLDRISKDYTIGDIVLYHLNTLNYGGPQRILHRIVGADSNGFITRGDANSKDDVDRVKPYQIIGKVCGEIR